MAKLFCFGFGYSAQALTKLLRQTDWQVVATCRDPAKAGLLTQAGVTPILYNSRQPLSEEDFSGVTHILLSVPPDALGDEVARVMGERIAHLSDIQWLGYLGTTGVYGDQDGAWVDENSPLQPAGPRGERRLVAEQQWLELYRCHGLPVHLFRLAGIYGPGRNVLTQLREGTAKRIDKPGHVFSRIHVDDIAQILLASIQHPNPGTAYNVADDEPAAPEAIVRFAAELLGQTPPPLVPFEQAELSEMARSFYADNKRVKNNRIKQDLAVKLLYPTYREGLTALFKSGEGR